jgi:hypothetical protein
VAVAGPDAIVFVVSGEVELTCSRGEQRRFSRGAVLCVTSSLVAFRNSGAAPARLLAIARTAR